MIDEKVLDWIALADRLIDDGDPRGARACASEILELDQNSIEGLALLAEVDLYLGDLDRADDLIRKVFSIDRDHPRARLVKGGIAAERFELDVELPTLRALIDECRSNENPSARSILFRALTWLSNGLYLAGEPSEAAECLLEASRLKKDRAAELYGKHLFYRNYRRPPSLETLKVYQSFFDQIAPFEHERPSRKKIRVGYVSPDFRRHAVANFVEPLIKHFDRTRFEVFCYQTTKGDEVTRRLKKNSVRWRELVDKTPLESARSIADDALDILVDLSGHTQNSCLPIMAHKPAPIQMTALGYVASTGLAAIDYYLSDEFCLPSEQPSSEFAEKIVRMPECHLCYAPDVVRKMPAVKPRLEKNFVTFGSFNNFAKISDQVLALWKKILERVEHSRLIIKAKTCSIESGREIVKRRLIKAEIDPERVELRPFSPDWLEQYQDVDVALDPFPYNGGLTTCEALYMGAPVIALAGRTHGSRIAASILRAARLEELIARNEEEYVEKAVGLANDLERLKNYRGSLRTTLKDSTLTDARRYMSELENIFEAMIRKEKI